MSRDFFFPFLSFFLPSSSSFLFFFFFFAFHFLKSLKFVWVYQNGNFYRQKALHAGKIGKSNSLPRKIFLLLHRVKGMTAATVVKLSYMRSLLKIHTVKHYSVFYSVLLFNSTANNCFRNLQ